MLYALEIDLDDAIEEFKRCPKHQTPQTPESHEKKIFTMQVDKTLRPKPSTPSPTHQTPETPESHTRFLPYE
jgi:hypothetical protein